MSSLRNFTGWKDQYFSLWNEYDNLSCLEAVTLKTVAAVNSVIYVPSVVVFLLFTVKA